MPCVSWEIFGNFEKSTLLQMPQLLMGLNFFQESSPKSYARPIDPKGSYFLIFNLLIEFLNLLIHLIKIKYEKNTKQMFWNLFMQHLHSLFTQDFVHTQKGKNLP